MEAMKGFEELKPMYMRLKSTTLGKAEIDKLFSNAQNRHIITKGERESLDHLTDSEQLNAYLFFNIMTTFLTHGAMQFERAKRMNHATMNFLGSKIR
jgi:hypothetical protein